MTELETEILDSLGQIASKLDCIDGKIDGQDKRINELERIVKHHNSLFENIYFRTIPTDYKLEIAATLNNIENRLNELQNSSVRDNVFDGILFLYITIIGIYSYISN